MGGKSNRGGGKECVVLERLRDSGVERKVG